MGAWVDAVEAKAGIIHVQLAAARALAEKHDGDAEDIARPYLELLRRLYEDEYVFARMVDSADLIVKFEGPALEASDAPVSIVMSVFTDLRDQIRRVAKSIVGLRTDRPLRWPAELDPHLAGLAPGSLVVGIRVPDPDRDRLGQASFADVPNDAFEAVRAAVRDIALVARHVHVDRIDDRLGEEFPDPAVRDTVMVAASRLAPTGRKGIDRVSLYAARTEPSGVRPLTPRSRAVLRGALTRPVRVRNSGSFDGIVREIDLDAKRFEIRSVTMIGALRCVYGHEWDRLVRTMLNARVRVRGAYETLPNKQPRLVAVEAIDVLERAPTQLVLDEDNETSE